MGVPKLYQETQSKRPQAIIPDPEAKQPMAKTERFLALDVFRGITIAGMILVNTPGSWDYVYAPLEHSPWHGCTPTDLVFPFFLFITGTAMRFSFRKFDHQPSGSVLQKLLRRVLVIFGIGLFLNSFPLVLDWSKFRILGVLQRIALAYGIGALLCLYLKRRVLIVISAILLFGYWIALLLGSHTPYAVDGNLAQKVDVFLIGANHLYKWGDTGIPFDPEGLFSTIPAVASVVLGYLIGEIIQIGEEIRPKVLKLYGWGIGLTVGGLVWSLVFPMNKPLWTSSYVLFTTGLATITLGICLWLIDGKGYKRWAHPFIVFGMNPLFIYTLSILWIRLHLKLLKFTQPDGSTITSYTWIYERIFVPIAGHWNGSLLFAIAHVVAFWIIAWVLYNRRIFIKI